MGYQLRCKKTSEWRTHRLERAYPYLYLDATYLKATWAGAVRNVALLVTVGVSDEGHREVLAVEIAPGERTEGYRGVLKGLVERGLRGVRDAATQRMLERAYPKSGDQLNLGLTED